MAKKLKKIESPETSFLDLVANAGITFEHIDSPINKKKDVKKTLCKYRGFVRVLRDEESVNKYIYQCKKNGILALDTETNNSLDIHDNIMIGLCLYTPFTRPVYIPVGHRDKITGELVEGQVSNKFLKEKIEELKTLKIIFHNAKFDVNVIRYNYDINLPIYWDTLIGAKILDENRLTNGLKFLYVDGIDPCMADYHVTTFFEDNTYANIEDFGLYSAIDPYDTYKVYEKQLKELSTPSMSKLKKLLEDLEFRVTEVCADMEWRGFTFDEELCKNYIQTESAKLKSLGDRINQLLEPYYDQIINWQYKKGGRGLVQKVDKETGLPIMKKKKEVVQGRGGSSYTKRVETNEPLMIQDPWAGVKMEWPVKLTSPDQVLCLLNCILKINGAGAPDIVSTVVDDLKATGSEIADLIGKYRHLNHNLTSFFKPYLELGKNGKMYATFNQMGGAKNGEDDDGSGDKTVKTGRFSSKDPNLQQLPARQGEDGVRLCFKASPGKSEAGADFSAQEPRVMSSLCGERELIDGYNLRTSEFPKGKDFYAMLASSAYGKDYWECTEFDHNGKFQQDGKNRRQDGKVIQLGVSYGMGAKLLVENLNKKKKPGEKKMTVEEGQKMMESFFGKFKSLKVWKDYNMARLEQFGYMETALGRRRRLFDTWLPDYEVRAMSIEEIEDIFFDMDLKVKMEEGDNIPLTRFPNSILVLDEERTKELSKKIDSVSAFKKKDLVEELSLDPLNRIKSNGGFKSRPKTQATNFVIQGGAAELTKRAMVSLYNHPDKERLGLGILAPVHDEILVEGYTECRKEVLKVLSECMSNSAKGLYEVSMICDGVIESQWNLGHFCDKIQKEFKKLIKGDSEKGVLPLSEEEAYKSIYNHYLEVEEDVLNRIVKEEFDPETDHLIPRKLCI